MTKSQNLHYATNKVLWQNMKNMGLCLYMLLYDLEICRMTFIIGASK